MSTVIPHGELRNPEILVRVDAGETFVVTRQGAAVATLTPYVETNTPLRFALTGDLMARRGAAAMAPGPNGEAWLADIRAADAEVADDPWDTRS